MRIGRSVLSCLLLVLVGSGEEIVSAQDSQESTPSADAPAALLPAGIEVQVLDHGSTEDHGYREKYRKSTGKDPDWFTGDWLSVP